MFTALGKNPRLSGNCSVCRDFQTTHYVATTLFKQDRAALRREFLRMQGWPSVLGRGGYRSRALAAFIGDPRPHGRPSAFCDAWPVEMDLQNTLEWLEHLQEGLRRVEHLDANGLGALWAATLQGAREVGRTLDRNLKRERQLAGRA